MKRLLVVACALTAAVAGPAGPAAADPPDDATYAGGCRVDAFTDNLGVIAEPEDGIQLVLAGAVVAYSPTAAHNTVQVDRLICTVRRDGSDVVTVPAGGTGPFAAIVPTTFGYLEGAGDAFEVCTTVDTTDAHGHERLRTTCAPVTPQELVPQFVVDERDRAVAAATAALDDLREEAAPALCVVTAAVAPIVLNAYLRIDEGGDVWLLTHNRVLDCPPAGD